MGPQQQQFVPWYQSPYASMMYTPPIGQVQAQLPPQPQSQPTPPQQSYLRGRMVESDTDIKPSEVPMDGTVTLFPKSDLSCIYAKTWTQDGVLKPLKFVLEEQIPRPEKEDVPQEVFDSTLLTNVVQQVVQDKLESIVQEYLSPIAKAQEDILSGLKKTKSSIIIPEDK